MPSGGLYNPLFFSLKTFTTGHRQTWVCRTLSRQNQLGNGNKEKNWMNSVHWVWPRPGPLTNLRNTDSARPRIGKGPRAKARLVRNSIRNRSRGPFLAQAPRRVPFSFSLSTPLAALIPPNYGTARSSIQRNERHTLQILLPCKSQLYFQQLIFTFSGTNIRANVK